jgi:hypothetical protein
MRLLRVNLPEEGSRHLINARAVGRAQQRQPQSAYDPPNASHITGRSMSLAVLLSRALCGMEAPNVSVEVHVAKGLPSFT